MGISPDEVENLRNLERECGGDINNLKPSPHMKETYPILPDGSSFFIGSFPLPKDHWSTVNPDDSNDPPVPFRVGPNQIRCDKTRKEWEDMLRQAGKYAFRASSSNGTITDIDPDALLKNLIIGFLGYGSVVLDGST